MDFYKVLENIMKERNLKVADISKMCDIPDSTLRGALTRKSKSIALSVAFKLSDGLNIPLEILNGDDLDNTSLPPNAIPVGEQGKLPIIGKVSAGMGVLAYDDVLGYEFADVRYCNENHFYLHVSGDSMTPEIKDGDLVLVRKQDSVDSGNYAVVVVDEEDGCVKIVKYGKDWIELHSINPYYPVRRFDNEDVLRIRVIGKVIEVKRKL